MSLAIVCGVPFPMFKKMEALTLETAIYPSIVPGVAKLLQNSPRLEKIKLDTVDCKMLEVYNIFNHQPHIIDHCQSSLFFLFVVLVL